MNRQRISFHQTQSLALTFGSWDIVLWTGPGWHLKVPLVTWIHCTDNSQMRPKRLTETCIWVHGSIHKLQSIKAKIHYTRFPVNSP